jgi:hypothetical protein
MTPEDWVREQLRHWRQDLINLSRTNRLLYFKATKSAPDILDLWVLYLGVGMLEWINAEGDERERVQSPILLVPVDLHHDNPQRPYQVRRADEDIAINPALAAKLEHDFGLTLPAIEEIEDSEPERLFESVGHLVREHPDWRVTPRVVLGTFSFHKEVPRPPR